MSTVYSTNEYILIDRNTNKPYRSSNGFTYTSPSRSLARDDKRIVKRIFDADTRIAQVKSRYAVQKFVR